MGITLPTVPAYYASPKLEYKIAQNIQVAFDSGLGWLDRSYHIARVGIDASQKSTYPQIYKNDGSKEHFDIRPDSSIGAYSFFEIDRPFVANKYENTLSCFFNVIFWCNLELVDPAKTYDYTSELISEVLDVLASQGAIVTETETRPENIFNNYSALQQELKQHLMRSYSGFKITFEVPTTLNDTCGDVVIDSCEQNVARINALPTSVKNCVIAAISDCLDATVENSDSSYTASVPSGDTLVLPDIDIVNSNSSFTTTHPAAKDYTIPNLTLSNSDSSYSESIPSALNKTLSDIQVTDSDGTVSAYPAKKNYVCTPQVKSTFLNFVFGIGATADFTTTIVSGEEGVYTANTLTNISSPVYYKNAAVVTLPITLVVSDVFRITGTITNTAIEARVKLTGTY